MKSAVFIVLAFASLANSQTPNFDDMLSKPRIGSVAISPDARYVAYAISKPDWDSNKYVSQLWIHNLANDEDIQLTRGAGISNFTWAPDSRRIAFTTARDGALQVYLIDVRGGEASRLTDVKNGVQTFNWSPDGKLLALTTSPPDAELKKRENALGSFTVVESDEAQYRLMILDVPECIPNAPVQAKMILENEPINVLYARWSPDSKRLAFVGAAPNATLETSIYVVQLSDLKPVKLMGPAALGGIVWSPDSKALAFTIAPKVDESFYRIREIMTVSADGGMPAKIANGIDESPLLLTWTSNGILISAWNRTSYRLYDLDPVTGHTRELTPGDAGIRQGYTFSRDGAVCAYTSQAPDRWEVIGVSPVQSFKDRFITQPAVTAENLPTREVVHWKSKDGTVVEGILIKPRDFDPKKKYPLLIVIHGGPASISTPGAGAAYAYPIDDFVKRGAIVLQPNYRGSIGYGDAFRALNVRNLGIGDAWDVLSGVDYLIAQGFVDPTHMGCMGWSQGGYISAFLTTTSDRFKAISVGAGISDWATYYYLTDITDFAPQYLKGTPWSDPEIYRKTSPITYVKAAKTPTLIQQGSNDARVPVPNSYELFRALRDLNVPVKFILYNGFGHGISKPKEQKALLLHNWEWFGKWIWGDK